MLLLAVLVLLALAVVVVVAVAAVLISGPVHPRPSEPAQVLYAYRFDTVTGNRVADLQPSGTTTTGGDDGDGGGFDLMLEGTYTAGVRLGAGSGESKGVLFSGTGTPGVAGGVGSRAFAQAAPATVPASRAVSLGAVFRTNLPAPIPGELPDSPNIAQSGLFESATQLKVQIDKDGRAGCRVKGLANGAGGASPDVFSPARSPVVADNAVHTVICTKGVDEGGKTLITLTVDGVDYSGAVPAVGDLALRAPLQVATNSASTAQTSDQFYGVLSALVWVTGPSGTSTRAALTAYLAGIRAH